MKKQALIIGRKYYVRISNEIAFIGTLTNHDNREINLSDVTEVYSRVKCKYPIIINRNSFMVITQVDDEEIKVFNAG